MPVKKDSRLARAGVSGFSDYCVYFHKKKNTDEIFYVGKGRRWRWNEKRSRNKHWSNIVQKYGFDVSIVASDLSNEKACMLEKFLIQELGLDNLVNYTLGGEGSEGYKHSQETKNKMRGRKLTEEHRKKLSQRKIENPSNYWKNKTRDIETKQKISLKLSSEKRYDAEKLLIDNIDRKEIARRLNVNLRYLRGLASRMRKKNIKIEKLIN